MITYLLYVCLPIFLKITYKLFRFEWIVQTWFFLISSWRIEKLSTSILVMILFGVFRVVAIVVVKFCLLSEVYCYFTTHVYWSWVLLSFIIVHEIDLLLPYSFIMLLFTHQIGYIQTLPILLVVPTSASLNSAIHDGHFIISLLTTVVISSH